MRFIRLEKHFPEPAEGLAGSVEGRLESMEIDLDDLCACRRSGICEFQGDGNGILRGYFRWLNREVIKSEDGVGHPEAEGEEGINLVFIVMAVADIEPLIVMDIDLGEVLRRVIWPPPFIAKSLEITEFDCGVGASGRILRGMDGGILKSPGEGDRQFPGRVHIAAEDVGDGIPAFLVGLPDAQ